jgi:hypothetical protein
MDGLKEGTRYGMLSYDIPKSLDDLANLIRSRIRKYALMVHESGYLIPWDHKDAILDIVKAAQLAINEKRAEAGQPSIPETKVRCLKLDADQHVEILDWAQEAMDRFMTEVRESFQKRTAAILPRIEAMIEAKDLDINNKAIEISRRKRAVLRELRKKVTDAEGVFVWFAMSGQVKEALKAHTQLFDAELKALRDVKMLGDQPMKQGRMPSTGDPEADKILYGS